MAEALVTTIEQRRSGARVIRFAGVLDEHNQLGELVDKVGNAVALLNLADLERINSSGVRDWINWLGVLQKNGAKPVLVACSPAVVGQLNRIKNFAGSALVKSFHVPYACAQCNVEKLVLVHTVDMGDAPPYRAPEHGCDACGREMTVAVEGDAYFSFLAHQPKPKAQGSRPEVDMSPSSPDLARGSKGEITAEHVKKISSPQLRGRQSQPSLSAFQLPDVRYSEQALARPITPPPSSRPYVIAILFLLILAVGVLAFMLLV